MHHKIRNNWRKCNQCQEACVLSAGITSTVIASMRRRLRLTSRCLVLIARQWVEIWPASAIKQRWILSTTYRKNLQFYDFYRASAHWRTILISQFCLSVCPSVRHISVFYRNGLKHTVIVSSLQVAKSLQKVRNFRPISRCVSQTI